MSTTGQATDVGAASSTDAMLVFGIMRTHNYISPYLDRSLRDLRLTAIQLNVLLQLRDNPDGLPLSEIGRRLAVSKANVTGLADRLEHKGLLERTNTADRRVTLARITPAGGNLLAEVLPRHYDLLTRIGDCLTDSQKKRLTSLLSRLREGMRAKGMHHHDHHAPNNQESANRAYG
jgi:MarR family transcriptional regulator, 2-MHQ and catechol-resistance regulon repressor